ncbi:MAG: cyclic nucleotide-binding domain-containing protein [Verrucomicrobia bacterium]|nr:cyclic nucleotide-binding domain-containing protein [Verrucomicrobiota bacterium]
MKTTALTVAARTRTLSTCPLFAGIPPADRALLAEMMETERLRAGETLFQAGDPSDRVYVVGEGRLAVFLPDETQPVRTLGPGDIIGEYGMFLNRGRSATLKAETDAALVSLDYTRFRSFLLRFPEAALVLLRTAVERLVAAETRARGSAQT